MFWKRIQPLKLTEDALLQFKITLLGIKPAIWRRIHVRNGTLAELHDTIQAVMGWENYHLHQFKIDRDRYGPPSPDDFGIDPGMKDESQVLLSQLLPKSGKRTRWIYEYDFGDGWRHQVQFEGCSSIEKSTRYPLCLEGQRACPPEDAGGPRGYAEYVKAVADPDHERHEEFMEWRGPFDPEAFDAKQATREMRNVP